MFLPIQKMITIVKTIQMALTPNNLFFQRNNICGGFGVKSITKRIITYGMESTKSIFALSAASNSKLRRL